MPYLESLSPSGPVIQPVASVSIHMGGVLFISLLQGWAPLVCPVTPEPNSTFQRHCFSCISIDIKGQRWERIHQRIGNFTVATECSKMAPVGRLPHLTELREPLKQFFNSRSQPESILSSNLLYCSMN